MTEREGYITIKPGSFVVDWLSMSDQPREIGTVSFSRVEEIGKDDEGYPTFVLVDPVAGRVQMSRKLNPGAGTFADGVVTIPKTFTDKMHGAHHHKITLPNRKPPHTFRY